MIFTFIKPWQVMAQMFLWMTRRKIEVSKTVLSRMFMNVKIQFGKLYHICVVKRRTVEIERNRPGINGLLGDRASLRDIQNCTHGSWAVRGSMQQAVAQAKKNVETKYFAVGILEELGMFLKFLEYGLPEYFAGSTEILSSKIGKIINQQSCTYPSRLSLNW